MLLFLRWALCCLLWDFCRRTRRQLAHRQKVRLPRKANPLPNAQVVFTNTETGKEFKTKTDKNGEFKMLGVPYGSYEVNVLNDKGEKLSSDKTTLGTGNTTNSNTLNIHCRQGADYRTASLVSLNPLVPSSLRSNSPKSRLTTRRLPA